MYHIWYMLVQPAIGGAEGVEVGADLGEDGAGQCPVDPRNGLKKYAAAFPRHEAIVDGLVESLDALLQSASLLAPAATGTG